MYAQVGPGTYYVAVHGQGQPITVIAAAPPAPPAPPADTTGYRLVTAAGQVSCFGGATCFGDLAAVHLNKPIVGIVATSSGKGYWLVASDGGIFNFGDATFLGSNGGQPQTSPTIGIATS